MEVNNYELNYSHFHCWEEKEPPCGLKHLSEDTTCCICRATKKEIEAKLTNHKV